MDHDCPVPVDNHGSVKIFHHPPKGSKIKYLNFAIKSFYHLKTLKKHIKKFNLYYYNGAQKHEGFVGFENACSRAKTYVILTSLNYRTSMAQTLMAHSPWLARTMIMVPTGHFKHNPPWMAGTPLG